MTDLKKEHNPIELRHEELNAILGRTPGKLVRYGVTIILCGLLALIAGSMVFPYPEIISCRIVITSSNVPVHFVAQQTGRIGHLFVSDREVVAKDQILAVLENTAYMKDMAYLTGLLDSLPANIAPDNFPSLKNLSLKLGDVTPAFIELQKALDEYDNFKNLAYYQGKAEALAGQIALTQNSRTLLEEQLILCRQDLMLEEENYKRDSLLYIHEVINTEEFGQAASRLIQKKSAWVNARMALENASVQLNQLNISYLDVQSDRLLQQQQHTDNVVRSLDALHNQVELWKRNYTFRSPESGIVSFSKLWAPNQWVKEGELLMSVVPLQEEKIIGKIEIPVSGSGKITEGQQVTVKLDNYPYMEFGVLKGVITSISLVPYEDFYMGEVELPAHLVSNYGTKIPFNQEMAGNADIIIQDMSLFERLLQPVKSAIRRQ